jgi:hypothetical protein
MKYICCRRVFAMCTSRSTQSVGILPSKHSPREPDPFHISAASALRNADGGGTEGGAIGFLRFIRGIRKFAAFALRIFCWRRVS